MTGSCLRFAADGDTRHQARATGSGANDRFRVLLNILAGTDEICWINRMGTRFSAAVHRSRHCADADRFGSIMLDLDPKVLADGELLVNRLVP
ncbi:hypothetical protein ACLOJK_006803 [Asimina triloba]